MTAIFYISAVVASLATVAAISRLNAVHALLYFILSLLAVALIFFVLGAPFAAALTVIINAGAIMVLFLFIIMMVNQGPQTVDQERQWSRPGAWIGPVFLALVLFGEVIYVLFSSKTDPSGTEMIHPKQVGATLFGPYLLGVELVSMILLVGLLGACHLARQSHVIKDRTAEKKS